MTPRQPDSSRHRRSLPARTEWALELLAVAPDDLVLELGCGQGQAAAAVAARLVDGRITAIDRSATAIARARTRLAEHVEEGRAALEHVELAAFRGETRFDKAFGVNVNVFWTSTAVAECEALTAALRPRGVVHLVYDTPPGRAAAVGEAVAATLRRNGLATTVRHGQQPTLVCVTGRTPAAGRRASRG